MSTWHNRNAKEVLRALDTDPRRGLTPAEAARRLDKHGHNVLEEHQRESLLKRFLRQMTDPMILVLLAAAVLSLVVSGGEDWIEAVVILVIVLVNACISISQEDSAEKALEALRKMSAPLAKALRGGAMVRVETTLLVPGDIILLEAGDLVPADARILESANLRADEAAMTGESVPVEKEAGVLPAETPLGDRRNMVISATVITNGRATCVVTGTGMDTEMGRIAGMLMDEEEPQTPLQRRMAEISQSLSFLCLAVCAVMFGVGLLQRKDMLEMFMTAVSLAVAAIPEGLPAIVTIVLAMGVQRMVRRNAIVKKLPAVETLGCTGVVCSDKTGTLTQNVMTAVEVWTASPRERTLALTIGALCNDSVLTYDRKGGFVTAGDPTETALVALAAREGVDKNKLEREMPRRGELSFDSERKLMSTVHPLPGGGFRVMVKGAPDVLLRRCATAPRAAAAANEEMASRALRVLGTAYKDLPALPARLESEALERGLTFAGLIGMIDPPRREVKAAVAQCYAAGIRPVMITGDHKLTAVAIARELDIFRDGDLAITG
ncbi:MAG: HAD-IC family P-type ATPase, partial [Candidatus Hydrogenedens sp.]|nr:HAD-IC family P-type ATPase [Candidatus Hydrogenedens sp.]